MAVAATGFFDGVHLGHRKVIETLLETARRRNEESLVITFWPHPRIVLGKDAGSLVLISSLEDKIARIKALGVDRIEVIPFTEEFASKSAADYLKMLAEDYSVSAVVIGYDTRLGSDQLGPDRIKSVAGDMDVVFCGPVGNISSTRIRKLLADGKTEAASEMLGYDYSENFVYLQKNKGSAG